MLIDALLDGDLLAIPSLPAPALMELEERLTYTRKVTERLPSGKTKQVEERIRCFGYDGDPEMGIAPRFVCPFGYRRVIETLLARRRIKIKILDVTPAGWRRPDTFVPQWDRLAAVKWKWLQHEIVTKLLKYRLAQIKTCTGYGKSFLIKCLCHCLTNAKIVVTSHSIDVVRQLFREIDDVCPDVGFRTGGKKFGLDRRIIVCSGKSLPNIVGCPDLLLVDEGHEFGTDDYLSKLAPFRYARKYMFSANCGDRSDGADFELEGVFGPIIVQIPYQDAVQHNCVVPIEVNWVRVATPFQLISPQLRTRTQKMRAGLWNNVLRNNKIADVARQFSAEEQVLIVVDKVEHAVRLKNILRDFTLVHGDAGMPPSRRAKYIKAGLLPPDEPVMTPQRRIYLARKFAKGELKKVIATGVWNRGVDFRSLSVLIRADGLISTIVNTQVPGRVARLHDAIGKQSGLIVDFTDEFDTEFTQRGWARYQVYKSHGWPQRRVEAGVVSTTGLVRRDEKRKYNAPAKTKVTEGDSHPAAAVLRENANRVSQETGPAHKGRPVANPLDVAKKGRRGKDNLGADSRAGGRAKDDS